MQDIHSDLDLFNPQHVGEDPIVATFPYSHHSAEYPFNYLHHYLRRTWCTCRQPSGYPTFDVRRNNYSLASQKNALSTILLILLVFVFLHGLAMLYPVPGFKGVLMFLAESILSKTVYYSQSRSFAATF